MSRRTLATVLAVALPLVSLTAAAAQDMGAAAPAITYELRLRDGSRLFGVVERETDTEVVFRTTAGAVVTARPTEIVSLRPTEGRVVRGEFMPADPNATRLFFAPTGRSLERGQAYLGIYEFLIPFVQVGITDRLSIGGGTPLIFGITDGNRPFWITPKLQVIDRGRVQAAVGALHAFDTDGDGGGIAYGVVTIGRSDAAVTAGAGVAYAVDGGRAAVVMIGGERQVRRSIKLVSENYVWSGAAGLLTGGVRFFGERLSADIGLAVPLGTNSFMAFPLVNFVYVF